VASQSKDPNDAVDNFSAYTGKYLGKGAIPKGTPNDAPKGHKNYGRNFVVALQENEEGVEYRMVHQLPLVSSAVPRPTDLALTMHAAPARQPKPIEVFTPGAPGKPAESKNPYDPVPNYSAYTGKYLGDGAIPMGTPNDAPPGHKKYGETFHGGIRKKDPVIGDYNMVHHVPHPAASTTSSTAQAQPRTSARAENPPRQPSPLRSASPPSQWESRFVFGSGSNLGATPVSFIGTGYQFDPGACLGSAVFPDRVNPNSDSYRAWDYNRVMERQYQALIGECDMCGMPFTASVFPGNACASRHRY